MFTEMLLRVVVAVGCLLPLALVAFVGRERLASFRREWRQRLRESAPVVAVLAVVLVVNRLLRSSAPRLSDEVGVHMTSTLYDLEGEFVFVFQSIETPALTAYFSVVYVYGYTFLLVFPILAYVALSDTVRLRRLLAAYALNYAIGLACYLVVIALGPRNVMPEAFAETMLYNSNPEYQHLTRQVNRYTNVFPSLHTSLSATVAIFAYRTRSTYSAWFPVAGVLAVSVAISTMYLGMHWATDVVAGIVLAAVSVVLSVSLVGRGWASTLRERVGLE
ncbi:phosphatidylglycerophosphatase [Halobiforma lacisalsi AJ5]|uniref:Phosphatidylglycerophosphatase n=1 Tax=Natronobacterium lacisalsi AJ5 TaxID=358396 RepID=M0LDB1_NATLA|nr:phosphatase PAP2 family protein [Halobiforma lacisalsi]APW99452.1 phosphatidylglycerophosphatase [Halobiforma lacisalsi AJ5]EMA31566.1 phosphoesterase PA-phosphatase-related protein [Halobiforma lacisalsi AJ5]